MSAFNEENSKTSQNGCQTRLRRRGNSGDFRKLPVEPFQSGRKRIVKVRVNETEHAALTHLGQSEGGISALIRRHLLGQGIADARRDALRELARLARNFNSIAAVAQTYNPERAVEIIAWLIVIERQIRGAIERISTK